MCMRLVRFVIGSLVLMLCCACYNHGQQTTDAWIASSHYAPWSQNMSKQQLDSISFSTTHHYTQNYNFLVRADLLPLADNMGDMAFDTMYVTKGQRIVVAEIRTLPTDSIDSVWVKVARDQITQGWIRESELLESVSPDDPISQFIDAFSNNHLLVFLAFCVIVGGVYAMRKLLRRNAYIVHFNDIDSFYPTLLCILMACSATAYATIQTFGAEQWRHYYFHPSLNPFNLPFTLGLFVASVWAIIIVGVAAVDDTIRRLQASDAFLYLLGLGAVCAVLYVVFSILTLYYVGYLLLPAYVFFALWSWLRFAHTPFHCGQCGAALQRKGTCPHCGAVNV